MRDPFRCAPLGCGVILEAIRVVATARRTTPRTNQHFGDGRAPAGATPRVALQLLDVHALSIKAGPFIDCDRLKQPPARVESLRSDWGLWENDRDASDGGQL